MPAQYAEFEYFTATHEDVLPTRTDIAAPGGVGEIRLQVSHDIDPTRLDTWLRQALVQYRAFKKS